MISEFKGEYSFLSNFAPVVGNLTGEHLYQAAKAPSREFADRILQASTPRLAKRLAWQIPQDMLPTNWDGMRGNIMLGILRWKFSFPGLRDALLDTGNHELREGNRWHDTYWGVCLGGWKCGKHEPVGDNQLGKLLMQARYEIRQGNY